MHLYCVKCHFCQRKFLVEIPMSLEEIYQHKKTGNPNDKIIMVTCLECVKKEYPDLRTQPREAFKAVYECDIDKL